MMVVRGLVMMMVVMMAVSVEVPVCSDVSLKLNLPHSILSVSANIL